MLSKLPPRPPLITPSASPPPQPSSSRNELPSPTKRQRTSSRSSSVRRSASVAESTLDFSKERRLSMARMLDTWSQLAERYSRRLDEDDIVDIRTGEIVKDNGFWKARRKFNFGEALQPEDTEDSVDDEWEDDEGIDELDAFEQGRHYIEDGFAQDLQQRLLTHPDNAVATDLDEFLEAEQRRKEEYGSDVEEDGLEHSREHHQGERSPVSVTTDSNEEEESSDINDQDVSSSHVSETYWEEQNSEYIYDDDDDDELDNWDPIEGSKVVPVRGWDSPPQAGASESDGGATRVSALTFSKRQTPPLQIHTPPPSRSLANSSDSDSVVSPRPLSADTTSGFSYSHQATSISPPSSPSKSRLTGPRPIRPQALPIEIIEITDDESPEPPSKSTEVTSSPPSSSFRLPVSNRCRSVVPEVVITTLPPRPATIARNGVATASTTTSNKSDTATLTKRAQRPTTPVISTALNQSAKSAKKTVVPGTLAKSLRPTRVSNQAMASGTMSSSTTPARLTKKITSSTIPTILPSVRKSTPKSKRASVQAKAKVTAPITVASNAHSDDGRGALESNLLHQETSPENVDYPATSPSPSTQLQASKSPPAKRKGQKRRRSSSVYEVAVSTKVQTDLPLSPHEAVSRGRVRASSAVPRRSSRRSLSRSRHSSDDDNHSSSNEDMSYKLHPRFTSVSTTPHVQPPYIPHTPTHHPGAYPSIVDARAQHIISQAMHQLATLFWMPTHSPSANPMYPYASRHTYPSVGSNFMPSTPDHPHPYPFSFDPSLSAVPLPPSSPEPPSSPVKPRERRKSIVSRSHSRGRRVSFRADQKGTESSEDEAFESEQRNNNPVGNNLISNEGHSSPLRIKEKAKAKGKGKQQAGIRHAMSSGSEQEDGESHSGEASVKKTRAAPPSAQKTSAGRPARGRPIKSRLITSGSSDLCSPNKSSKVRKNNGGSSDRV